MTSPLDGPLRKLERAWHHLERLDASAADFGNKAYSFSQHFDLEDFHWVYQSKIVMNPSYSLALIAGDGIHNMRAALDLLALQLVLAGEGESAVTVATGFPILARWNKARFYKMVSGMPTEAKRIIEALQPGQGGDLGILLGRLHALDIADKHRLIQLTISDLSVVLPVKMGDFQSKGQWLEDGTFEVRVPKAIIDANPDFEPKPTGTICFDSERTCLADLGSMYQVIRDGVIPSFARFFP